MDNLDNATKQAYTFFASPQDPVKLNSKVLSSLPEKLQDKLIDSSSNETI